MKRNIASTLFLLVLATYVTSEELEEDYSEEDEDFYHDFDSSSIQNEWDQDSSESYLRGPLNLRGSVRTRFALDAALANPDKSLICSPVSALLPLGKLAIGAEGQCLKQLLRALGLSEKRQLKKAFKPLLNGLEYLSGVALSVVSKMYISDNIELKSKFRRRAKKIFKATVVKADFSKPSAVAKRINDWVNLKTQNMIPDIITPNEISPHTSMILINAVYFSGKWANKFEKVAVDNFFTPTAIRKMPMMTREGRYRYGRSDNLDAQIVEIPYEGHQASFVIILPNSKHGLPVLLHKLRLAPELLQQALGRAEEREIILTMPKFKSSSQIDLRVSYEKLGLTEIFQTKNSGLEKMVKGDKDLYVSKAIQKAVIEVNEYGTKASAASLAHLVKLSLNLHEPIFNANHPFMYFIQFKKEQIFSGIFVH